MKLNKVYCMDNLKLLRQLPSKCIDLIYCDVLYNTGKKFKDYNDNLGTPQEAIEWYRPRLIEMRRVLKDSGSIYLQCDYRLVHYLKVEMDDVFGFKNFRNEIIWCYNTASNEKKGFLKKHDTILRYSKSDNFKFNADDIRIPYNEETIARYKRGKPGRGNKTELNQLGKIPEDWWQISIIKNQGEKVGYATQKPKALAERIIKASSNKGDVIADFFCGSGTTLVAAKELGRQYIGCDINPKAVDITRERLEKIEKFSKKRLTNS